MKTAILACALVILAQPRGHLSAQEGIAEAFRRPACPVDSVGLIFSTTDILMSMESFRGGIGMEIALEESSIRVWLDLLIHTEFNPFSLTLGGAFKKQFGSGFLSPYGGGYLEVGFSRLRTGIDDSNWTQVNSLALTPGAILGLQVFLLDFLSLFVEYDLSFKLSYSDTRVSVDSTETSSGEWNYTLNVGLGNSARIGIVIYIWSRGRTTLPAARRPGARGKEGG